MVLEVDVSDVVFMAAVVREGLVVHVGVVALHVHVPAVRQRPARVDPELNVRRCVVREAEALSS